MSLVLETGAGLSNADSYVSIAESDTYISNSFFPGDWSGNADYDKEKLLKTATKYLDSFYDFKGDKTVPTSSLRWPRRGVYDSDGLAIGENTIPDRLKSAVIELAIYLASNNLLEEQDSRGIKDIKVDVVEITFERSEKGWKMPNTVSHFMRGLGTLATNAKVGKLIDA